MSIMGFVGFIIMVSLYNTKVIISGNTVEYYKYSSDMCRITSDNIVKDDDYLNYHYQGADNTDFSCGNLDISDIKTLKKLDKRIRIEKKPLTAEQKNANRKASRKRSFQNIKRLAACNFGSGDWFVTFDTLPKPYLEGKKEYAPIDLSRCKTDSEKNEVTERYNANKAVLEASQKGGYLDKNGYIHTPVDCHNLTECWREYSKFVMRLKDALKCSLKTITVVHFQDGKRNKMRGIVKDATGAIHFHVLIQLPKIEWIGDFLQSIWGHGQVFCKQIKARKGQDVGAYCGHMVNEIAKYAGDTDKIQDTRLDGRKAYSTSRNLLRPATYYADSADKAIEIIKKSDKKPYNKYVSKYTISFDIPNKQNKCIDKKTINVVYCLYTFKSLPGDLIKLVNEYEKERLKLPAYGDISFMTTRQGAYLSNALSRNFVANISPRYQYKSEKYFVFNYNRYYRRDTSLYNALCS